MFLVFLSLRPLTLLSKSLKLRVWLIFDLYSPSRASVMWLRFNADHSVVSVVSWLSPYRIRIFNFGTIGTIERQNTTVEIS